jgi:hypothetical protein
MLIANISLKFQYHNDGGTVVGTTPRWLEISQRSVQIFHSYFNTTRTAVQWWALPQNGVDVVVDGFHFDRSLALLGHIPNVPADGPRLLDAIILQQISQLPVSCRGEVLHNDDSFCAHL